jgi:hypothetical protein
MIHLLHHFPFSVDFIIWFFLIDVAPEVVLVVGLPRLRAHVAETFAAFADHEVAAHRTLHCLPAGGTDLCVLRDPFGIGLFLYHLLHPLCLLLAFARVVVVALAPKTEDLAAVALDCVLGVVDFDAIAAICARAELIVSISCDE